VPFREAGLGLCTAGLPPGEFEFNVAGRETSVTRVSKGCHPEATYQAHVAGFVPRKAKPPRGQRLILEGDPRMRSVFTKRWRPSLPSRLVQ
jgi:hypothetical protein